MPLVLAHVWSSDMGAALSRPFLQPQLDRGWRVFVLSPPGPRLGELQASPGITWLPLSLTRRRFDLAGDLRAALQLAAYYRRHRFDLMHTHNIKAGLIGRVTAGLVRAPRIVHTVHGMPFDRETPAAQRYAHVSLEWLACRFVDRVFVQSDEDEATLLAHRVVPRARVVKIGNGVSLTRFDPGAADRARVRAELELAEDDVLFVSAGRLVREKGFVELAQAAARARAVNPRVRLAIAGPRDPEKADALDEDDLAAARAGGVSFLGERTDMPDVYAAADVVVLASWHEGLPRVLIEGAAMGRALLASDARGCREVVVAPEGGERVPVRSPEALAAAMLRLAADPARRAAAGAFNRHRALDRYDLALVIGAVDASYRELLEAR